MGIASEFKEFAVKGNVIDLAVGVIIGAAFGKIVDSLVNDLIMPLIGRATGGLDFSNFFIALREIPPNIPHTLEAVKKAGVPVFAWGNFVTIALNFVILAFIVFMMVKQVNRLKKEAPPPAPAPTPEDVLLLRHVRVVEAADDDERRGRPGGGHPENGLKRWTGCGATGTALAALHRTPAAHLLHGSRVEALRTVESGHRRSSGTLDERRNSRSHHTGAPPGPQRPRAPPAGGRVSSGRRRRERRPRDAGPRRPGTAWRRRSGRRGG